MLTCIFCTASKHAIIENERFYAIADKYPVTPGHLLLIPKAHRRDYFALTQEELQDLQALLQEGKAYLLETYRPDGFNIGFNCGEAAGQTVFHCHCHLIPRYQGDVEQPNGGVRGVIHNKQAY
ncbi:HIT family protein [Enterococcus casseliflavus]|nr:HIT family protein [Enterococcus casseliflavus]